MKVLKQSVKICALLGIVLANNNTNALAEHRNILNQLSVKTSHKIFLTQDADAYLFFMHEGLQSYNDKTTIALVSTIYPDLQNCFTKGNFTGKANQTCTVMTRKNDQYVSLFFLGIGKDTPTWNVQLEALRRALGSGIQLAKKYKASTIFMTLPSTDRYQIDKAELVKQLTTVAHLATYEFTAFKAATQPDWQGSLLIGVDQKDETDLQQSIITGSIIGISTNMVRLWGDYPPNILTPTVLSQQAQAIAYNSNLTCTVLGREDALTLGMGAFCAVDAGSTQDGKIVIMEYCCGNVDAPTIALVGKGVTFDTGGISLKPADSMSGMKYDMCGAGAVIATMNVVGQLKPNVNVIGLTPLVENMPDGAAARQDDIVTAMNGKTIEIKNTDAEGRLILADTLCYAEKFYKPDIIIDLATLTGACKMALGHFYAALMTKDSQLFGVLPLIGALTGDRVWPLPLDNDYKPANESDFADLANSGSSTYKAGSIIAGCFLSEFVESSRWAHLDIASTAANVPRVSYLGNGKGCTGAGVRLLSEFILNYDKYK